MVEGGDGGAAGGCHWAGDLHYCRRLLLIHTEVAESNTCKTRHSSLRTGSFQADVPQGFLDSTTNPVRKVSAGGAAHLKLYGHFPPYWSLNCCSWKQLELSSEHGLCSSLLIFSCSPWKATRFQKTKAEVRLRQRSDADTQESRCLRRPAVITTVIAKQAHLMMANHILRTTKIPLKLLFCLTGDRGATIRAE